MKKRSSFVSFSQSPWSDERSISSAVQKDACGRGRERHHTGQRRIRTFLFETRGQVSRRCPCAQRRAARQCRSNLDRTEKTSSCTHLSKETARAPARSRENASQVRPWRRRTSAFLYISHTAGYWMGKSTKRRGLSLRIGSVWSRAESVVVAMVKCRTSGREESGAQTRAFARQIRRCSLRGGAFAKEVKVEVVAFTQSISPPEATLCLKTGAKDGPWRARKRAAPAAFRRFGAKWSEASSRHSLPHPSFSPPLIHHAHHQA